MELEQPAVVLMDAVAPTVTPETLRVDQPLCRARPVNLSGTVGRLKTLKFKSFPVVADAYDVDIGNSGSSYCFVEYVLCECPLIASAHLHSAPAALVVVALSVCMLHYLTRAPGPVGRVTCGRQATR